MKVLLYLCILGLVGLALADTKTHSRGCIYAVGKCVRECEEGTHAYALGCGFKTPEPTCDEPNPVAEKSMLCDYSDCYCDPPTVRDTKNNVCVPLDKCPNSLAEPTCDEPTPCLRRPCYVSTPLATTTPTVRDTKNNQCVPLDKCPK